MLLFTCSFSSDVSGMLPTSTESFSALIASDNFFCCCSLAKCGKRSVIVNTGSSSFSPSDT